MNFTTVVYKGLDGTELYSHKFIETATTRDIYGKFRENYNNSLVKDPILLFNNLEIKHHNINILELSKTLSSEFNITITVVFSYSEKFINLQSNIMEHAKYNLKDLNSAIEFEDIRLFQHYRNMPSIKAIREYLRAGQCKIPVRYDSQKNKKLYKGIDNIELLKEIINCHPIVITALPDSLQTTELWLIALSRDSNLHYYCPEIFLHDSKICDYLNSLQIQFED